MKAPPANVAQPLLRVMLVGARPDRLRFAGLLAAGTDLKCEFLEAATVPEARAMAHAWAIEPLCCAVLDVSGATDPAAVANDIDLLTGLGAPVLLVSGFDRHTNRQLLRSGAQEVLRREQLDAENVGRAVEHSVERWGWVQELRATEDRARRSLQSLADTLPSIVARFDTSLRHVFINEAVVRATGRPRSTFLGKTNRDLGMPAELCDRWDDALRATFETGEPRTIAFDFEGRSFVSRLVREETDQGPFVLTICHDVSELNETERSRRIEQERLHHLADAMPQLVWRASSNGVVDYYNARVHRYFGAALDDAGRWHWQLLVHPDDLQRTQEAWSAAAAQVVPYACEHRIRMVDGTWRWHMSRAEPHRGSNGVVTWYGTATDMHDLKLAEQRLESALREAELAVQARNQMLSLVSHDLKNPLATVALAVGSLQRLQDRGALTPDRLAPHLGRVSAQVRRMASLIDELVDTAWLQTGAPLALRRAPTDVGAIAQELVDEARRTAIHHHFEVRVPPEPVLGQWDVERLTRVLGNLIDNARKYSPDGGRIIVELAHERVGGAAWARLSVTDQGIGVGEA
ncbi:MAG: PAS domain-containing sensor histidine kinase, partial [Myxococcaceae bacterium]|nr:PAS domain-containing sensor histidine kinase [Myxococcaceae bacterium]